MTNDIQRHRLRIPASGTRQTPDELLSEFNRRPRRRNVVSADISEGALVVVFTAKPDEVEKRARYIFCDVAMWPNNSSAEGKYEVVAEVPPTEHTFTVTVSNCTREQAKQVMAERIDFDEDYGFTYEIGYA